jgi:hypothetical protein
MNTMWKRIRWITLMVILVVAFTFAGGYQPAQARVTFPLQIPADVEWVSTGIYIDVANLSQLNIHTTGLATTGPIKFYRGSKSGPEGQPFICEDDADNGYFCALSGQPFGMLIGKMGATGGPFPIGDADSFTIPISGYLYLAVNDYLGTYFDNNGGFTVLLVFK